MTFIMLGIQPADLDLRNHCVEIDEHVKRSEWRDMGGDDKLDSQMWRLK
jgi:hypothetical protein